MKVAKSRGVVALSAQFLAGEIAGRVRPEVKAAEVNAIVRRMAERGQIVRTGSEYRLPDYRDAAAPPSGAFNED
jgi:hypothetical protein